MISLKTGSAYLIVLPGNNAPELAQALFSGTLTALPAMNRQDART
jgi:hypothetical protein